MTQRGTPPAESTLLRRLAVLAAVLKIARRHWEWLDHDPLEHLDKPAAGDGRKRYLSEDERRRLLAACKASTSPHLYPIVVVALATGMRLGEIRGMRWSDLSIEPPLAVGLASLAKTKNGDGRAVAITEPALSILRNLNAQRQQARRSQSGYVFHSSELKGRKPIDIRTPWEGAVKKAKLHNFRFHDLRHTAASYLAMNGATPNEIADVLGHKTLSMVMRYVHLSAAHTQNLVARVNEKIFKEFQS